MSKRCCLAVGCFCTMSLATMLCTPFPGGRQQVSAQEIAEERPPVMLLSLAFSRHGRWLVAGGDLLRVYDLDSGELKRTFTFPGRLSRMTVFSPTEENVFAASGDGNVICLYDVSREMPVRQLRVELEGGTIRRLHSAAFSPQGDLLTSAGAGGVEGRLRGELRVWSTKTGKVVHSRHWDDFDIQRPTFSPDGKLLALVKMPHDKVNSSTIEIFRVSGWRHLLSIPFSPGIAMGLTFRADSKTLLIAEGICIPQTIGCKTTGKMWLASLGRMGEPAKLLPMGRQGYFRSMDAAPRGDSFVTAASTYELLKDPTGRAVGKEGGPVLQRRRAHDAKIEWLHQGKPGMAYGAQFSPDGKRVGWCLYKTIEILDADSGTLLKSIRVKEK